jgi:uncharacterized protein YfaP (DUF2135 family)
MSGSIEQRDYDQNGDHVLSRMVDTDAPDGAWLRTELDHEPTEQELDDLAVVVDAPDELQLATDAGPVTMSNGQRVELVDAVHNGHRGCTLRREDPDGWHDIGYYFADGSEFTAEHPHPAPQRSIQPAQKRRRR